MRHIKEMDKDNMDEMIVREDWPAAEPLITTTKRKRAMEGGTTTTKRIRLSKTLEEMLSANLIDGFQKAFDIKYPHGTMLYPDNLFGQPQIDNIINNFGTFDGKAGLSKIIGGRFIPGQIDILNTVINDFTTGPLANEEALKINTKAASREDAKAQKLSEKQAQREQKSREKDQERAAIQEAKRVEAEKGEARTCIEVVRGKEQKWQLRTLIRLAGEDAERRGVQSIHRGRYTIEDCDEKTESQGITLGERAPSISIGSCSGSSSEGERDLES
ncbi:hypothetical protein Pst134EA_007832 [Puccinia striiformis f. sp. tritici]|nr:hypothetical protein Pst134EA_007832 [Puccinia striiformis f. sp. tritici]KAH9470586.1 hypothetical protein Pst134EA_007832 [Puccinia striiformis f. sp. tritici]